MSQENVELVRHAYDAVNRRDLGAFLTLMDADVEAVSILVGIEGRYHGHAGIRRWWGNLLDAFPDFRLDVIQVRDLGDLTLASLRYRGHGADSGAPVQAPLWQVIRWRRGRCVQWRSYETEAEALEAAGLRE
jgi:ketosteroid isomerase-like protein